MSSEPGTPFDHSPDDCQLPDVLSNPSFWTFVVRMVSPSAPVPTMKLPATPPLIADVPFWKFPDPSTSESTIEPLFSRFRMPVVRLYASAVAVTDVPRSIVSFCAKPRITPPNEPILSIFSVLPLVGLANA